MEKIDLREQIKLAVKLGSVLEKLKLSLATAESCTGGWIAHVLTSVPRSSSWFERGFVTYSKQSKVSLLSVKKSTLKEFGAVSKETVIEMVEGALNNSEAQLSIAVTGVAGPDEEDNIPVGTCWFAWTGKALKTEVAKVCFQGDRNDINYQAVEYAINQLISILATQHPK